MAVDIVEHRQDGGALVRHGELGHGGVVLGVNVQFVTRRDGTLDADYLLLPCPVCDAVSTHPVSGGSNPPATQHQFGRLWQMRAEELGIPPEKRGWNDIKMMVCERVWALDGDDRICYLLNSTGPNDYPVAAPGGPKP
jgi:hypothetical protein